MTTIANETNTTSNAGFTCQMSLNAKPTDDDDAGKQAVPHQQQKRRRSLKQNELIHRMLSKYNLSHLFPAHLSRDDIVEVIAYLLVEREDLLLLSKLESENASLGLLAKANNSKAVQQRSASIDRISPTPADYFYSGSTVVHAANSTGGSNDEEINFFAAVHREVVNALAEENQKLQDKVIEERIQNDELRKLVFALKSRFALLDPNTSAGDIANESITAMVSSSSFPTAELQQIGRSKSQPCSLAAPESTGPPPDGDFPNTFTPAKISSSSSDQLNSNITTDPHGEEQDEKHNYKKRMQILSHVITAMQKHYMSEIGQLRKEVQRLRIHNNNQYS